MPCTEGLCSAVCRAASDGEHPGDSAYQVRPLSPAQAFPLPATLSCPAAQQLFVQTRPRLPGPSLQSWDSTQDLPALEDQLPAGAWVEMEP